MTQPDDWRLTWQERYLTGVLLEWVDWSPPRLAWDHGHCNFCWAKFATPVFSGVLDTGYATPERRHWVCPTCFADFRGLFNWQVLGSSARSERRDAEDSSA